MDSTQCQPDKWYCCVCEWKLCERFYCLFQYAIQENKSFETHFNDTSARPHFTPILAILNWNFDLARLITHFCVFVCLCSYFRYLHTSALGEFYQFVDSHHLATTCTNTWIVNFFFQFFASLCEYKCVNSPSMRASSKWNLFKIQRKLALLCIPSIAFLSPCDFNASDLFPYLNSDPWFFIHEYTIFFFAVFIQLSDSAANLMESASWNECDPVSYFVSGNFECVLRQSMFVIDSSL